MEEFSQIAGAETETAGQQLSKSAGVEHCEHSAASLEDVEESTAIVGSSSSSSNRQRLLVDDDDLGDGALARQMRRIRTFRDAFGSVAEASQPCQTYPAMADTQSPISVAQPLRCITGAENVRSAQAIFVRTDPLKARDPSMWNTSHEASIGSQIPQPARGLGKTTIPRLEGLEGQENALVGDVALAASRKGQSRSPKQILASMSDSFGEPWGKERAVKWVRWARLTRQVVLAARMSHSGFSMNATANSEESSAQFHASGSNDDWDGQFTPRLMQICKNMVEADTSCSQADVSCASETMEFRELPLRTSSILLPTGRCDKLFNPHEALPSPQRCVQKTKLILLRPDPAKSAERGLRRQRIRRVIAERKRVALSKRGKHHALTSLRSV